MPGPQAEGCGKCPWLLHSRPINAVRYFAYILSWELKEICQKHFSWQNKPSVPVVPGGTGSWGGVGWKGMPSCVPRKGEEGLVCACGPGTGCWAPGWWTVWKWGRGVAGCEISSGKKGVCCGESTGRSGKRAVNTSPSGLLPSLFPLQRCHPQQEEKWELKPRAFGGVGEPAAPAQVLNSRCLWPHWCSCKEGMKGMSLAQGGCTIFEVLEKPWVLQGCSSAGRCLNARSFHVFACSSPQFIALPSPSSPQNKNPMVYQTSFSPSAFLSLVFSPNCMPRWGREGGREIG